MAHLVQNDIDKHWNKQENIISEPLKKRYEVVASFMKFKGWPTTFAEEVEDQLYCRYFLFQKSDYMRYVGEINLTKEELPNDAALIASMGWKYKDNYKEVIKKKEEVDMGESLVKCKKCGGNTIFVISQKRSGDEAMSIEYKCQNPSCNNKSNY
jgi:DNA-directed RNA polymerase subunit M/transcription elongation factor TFIIS